MFITFWLFVSFVVICPIKSSVTEGRQILSDLEAFGRLVLRHSKDISINLMSQCKMNLCIFTAGIGFIRAAEYSWQNLTTFIFRSSVLI